MIEKYTRNRYEDGWMSELKGNILGSWIKNSNKWKCETQSDVIILQKNGEYKIDFRDIPPKKEHVRLGGHYAEFKQPSPKDCWKKCNQDEKCYAFSTSRNDSWHKNYCFLFGETFGAWRRIYSYFIKKKAKNNGFEFEP